MWKEMCYKAKLKKITKNFDDESIAMMWKEMWDNAQFEKSQII